MGKLDALWAYQQADMEVVRYENEMRKDPTRSKLVRLRNFVTEQQGEIQNFEVNAQKALQRVSELDKTGSAGEEYFAERAKGLDTLSEAPLEEVQAALKEAQGKMEAIRTGEQEIRRILSDAEAADAKLRDIRQKVAQARAQYNTLKEGYDKTYAEQVEKLEALRGKRTEAAVGVEKQLIDRYESVKKQCVPPMAQLQDDQCGGCRMSLPAALVKRVRDGQNIVECENCGRILYLQ